MLGKVHRAVAQELRCVHRPGHRDARAQGSRRRRGAVQEGQDLDPKRGEAYYNLGACSTREFRASKNADLGASIGTYKQAKDYFQQFLSSAAEQNDKGEAKEQIALIDKTVAQIQQFMKTQANQPAGRRPLPRPAGRVGRWQ